MQQYNEWQKLTVEFVGTALLLASIIGSGIMAENLSLGNDGVTLLANSIAVGGALYVLITIFAPISGAHYNPAVTVVMVLKKKMCVKLAAAYIVMQIIGALSGSVLAHAMFDLPLIQESMNERESLGQWIAEGVATFGLLITILAGARHCPKQIPVLVASYILAGFWFTASTSFANPAVTIGRSITDTFAGIAPADILGFALSQCAAIPFVMAFDKFILTPTNP